MIRKAFITLLCMAATAKQAVAKAKSQEELGQKDHADVTQMEAYMAGRQYDLTNTYP